MYYFKRFFKAAWSNIFAITVSNNFLYKPVILVSYFACLHLQNRSVFFQCLKYSKVIKIICFCEHKKTLKPAEASRLCSEKGRPSNDKIYSTRILCIDCKQNKLQKYWWTKCIHRLFLKFA